MGKKFLHPEVTSFVLDVRAKLILFACASTGLRLDLSCEILVGSPNRSDFPWAVWEFVEILKREITSHCLTGMVSLVANWDLTSAIGRLA